MPLRICIHNDFKFLKIYIYTPKIKNRGWKSETFWLGIVKISKCQNTNVWLDQNCNTFFRRFWTLLTLRGLILYRLFGSLRHARLTAIISAFGIDILLVKIIFYHGRKSSMQCSLMVVESSMWSLKMYADVITPNTSGCGGLQPSMKGPWTNLVSNER